MTVTPSARWRTSIRHRLRATAADRPAAMSSRPRPSSPARAAAASAFGTWCAPCSRRVTGADPSGVSSVKLGRPRSSSRTSAARNGGVGLRGAAAEGDDAGPGAGGHGRTRGSSALRMATPSGGQGLDQLALGPRHLVQAAELAGVRVPDVQHHAVAGRRDAAQVGDVPDAPGGHLQHQVPGRVVGAQHGQRQAELGVERPGRRDRRPEPLHQLGGQVLGRGLPRRPGDAGDPRRGQRVQPRLASAASAAGTSATSTEGTGTGRVAEHRDRARGHRGGGEIVPVRPLPATATNSPPGRPAGSR